MRKKTTLIIKKASKQTKGPFGVKYEWTRYLFHKDSLTVS